MIATFIAILIVGCIIGEPKCKKIMWILLGIMLVIGICAEIVN